MSPTFTTGLGHKNVLRFRFPPTWLPQLFLFWGCLGTDEFLCPRAVPGREEFHSPARCLPFFPLLPTSVFALWLPWSPVCFPIAFVLALFFKPIVSWRAQVRRLILPSSVWGQPWYNLETNAFCTQYSMRCFGLTKSEQNQIHGILIDVFLRRWQRKHRNSWVERLLGFGTILEAYGQNSVEKSFLRWLIRSARCNCEERQVSQNVSFVCHEHNLTFRRR